ncbi:MAG: class I SAM-dependent methyltransferase [Armatimonadetes bacterium]|nr:class I SAM-dependent methyltransferase [Armatimonadota bacterium]
MQSLRRFMAKPFRFVQMDEFLSRENAKVLDVGCGNHSPRRTKKYYPQCQYFGLDKSTDYNIEAADLEVMEHFYQIDLTDPDALDPLPDNYFDCIIMSHVIEHLKDGELVISKLCRKLAPGGGMYIETPSPHSAKLPHMSHTLNFYDDPTHVRIYDLGTICEAVEAGGLVVRKAAVRRDWRGIVLIPYSAIVSLKQLRKITGPVFWDLFGFASFVVATKPKQTVLEEVIAADG